ncbi:MAG: ATP-binding protein [Desulfobacterales bacterium]
MGLLHKRRLYFSAYAIILVVVLLLGIIGVSTYRNWNRERRRALDYVHGQGLILMEALGAGARAGMRMGLRASASMESLSREMAANPDLFYIYLYDEAGTITHHSDRSKRSQPADWQPIFDDDRQIVARTRQVEGQPMVYEMATPFAPLALTEQARTTEVPDGEMTGTSHAGGSLVLGLSMARYDANQREDLHHALVMGGILLVLGTGVLFFILVIQNYTIVNRSLQASKDFNRLVLQSMADGLMSIDPQGRIVTCNQQARNLLGLNEKKVAPRNIAAILDMKKTGIQQALTRRQAVTHQEIHHRRGPEDVVTIGLTISPLAADPEPFMGAVLVLRDLTQVKRLSERVRQAEKLAAIGTLAAGVAHEIRNPLSSIRGFAQFIRHRLGDRPQEQEYAAVMVREIDRIDHVVSDLLSLARPAVPQRRPTSISDLLDHTLKLISADARARRIAVELTVAQEMPRAVLDGNQVTQALLNLLINALEATPAGGRIVLGARSDSPSRQIVLWVEDNGPGIAQADLERIFEPFFTTRQTGTGLGLAIVNNIAASHGGQIRIESPLPGEPRGCRISIWLPWNDPGGPRDTQITGG